MACIGVTYGLLSPRSTLNGVRISPPELSGVQLFDESELFFCDVCSDVRCRLDTIEEPDDKSCPHCLRNVSLSSIVHADKCTTCFLCPLCSQPLRFNVDAETAIATCEYCGFDSGVVKATEDALIKHLTTREIKSRPTDNFLALCTALERNSSTRSSDSAFRSHGRGKTEDDHRADSIWHWGLEELRSDASFQTLNELIGIEHPERSVKAAARALLSIEEALPLRQLLDRPSQSRFPRGSSIQVARRPQLQARFFKRCGGCSKILSKCYRRGTALIYLTSAFLGQWTPWLMLKQAVVGEPAPISGSETRTLRERFQPLKPGFKGYIDLVVANRRDVQVTITVEAGLTALNRNNESASEPYSDICTLKIVQPKLSFDLLPGSENDALNLEPTGDAWGVVAKQDSAVLLRVPAEARMTLTNDHARCCLPMHITFNETMSSTIYPILSLGLFDV